MASFTNLLLKTTDYAFPTDDFFKIVEHLSILLSLRYSNIHSIDELQLEEIQTQKNLRLGVRYRIILGSQGTFCNDAFGIHKLQLGLHAFVARGSINELRKFAIACFRARMFFK